MSTLPLISLSELRHKIEKKEKEIAEVKLKVSKWVFYKETGCHEEAKHIKLLEEEKADMEGSFNEMTSKEHIGSIWSIECMAIP